MPSLGATRQDIPVYALYGEADAPHLPLAVHAETISSRSSGFDWRIAPHRHSHLFQALLITEGHAVASAEGERVGLPARSLAWVPPLCVHAYDFTPGTVGIVVSVPASLLSAGLALAPSVLSRLGRFAAVSVPEGDAQWDEAEFLSRTLLTEHQTPAAGREAALLSRATLLALWTARQTAAGSKAHAPANERPGAALVRRFLEAVESDYAEHRPLADYARRSGVSLAHLHRVCRSVTGRSPARLIQDRRLVEAKRHLTYTALPVAQIAYRLGFEDSAYFSRFFRQRTGMSPLRYRRAADAGAPGESGR